MARSETTGDTPLVRCTDRYAVVTPLPPELPNSKMSQPAAPKRTIAANINAVTNRYQRSWEFVVLPCLVLPFFGLVARAGSGATGWLHQRNSRMSHTHAVAVAIPIARTQSWSMASGN